MQKNKVVIGYIFVIASAILFGCMPLMTSQIYLDGVNSFTLVFLRNLLSLPMLAVAAKMSGGSLKINPRALPSLSVIALMGCCVTPILLYTSYSCKPMSTGMATVFHFIYPAVVVLLGALFLKNKIKIGELASLVICIAGICMFYNPGEAFSTGGAVIALLSGVTYAIYVVGIAGFRYKEISGFVFTFYGAAVCAVVSVIVCLVSGKLQFPTSLSGWLLSVLFAFVFNVGAVVLFQRGTALIGGERASILSTFEPITSVIVGIAFMKEPGDWRTAVGTALVVLASVLIALFDMKEKKKGQQNG